MSEFIFEVKKLSKTYENNKVLDIQELKIPKRKLIAIVGYSGSGKTTLINHLGLLDIPDYNPETEMLIDNRLIKFNKKKWQFEDKESFENFRKKNFGFVFQDNFLPKTFKVQDIFLFANINFKKSQKKIEEILMNLNIPINFLKKPIYKLSGGEAERIAIALAVSNSPSIIFADEPTSNLDYKTGKKVLAFLKAQLKKNNKMTIIWISHNLIQVQNFADIVFVLVNGRITGEILIKRLNNTISQLYIKNYKNNKIFKKDTNIDLLDEIEELLQ